MNPKHLNVSDPALQNAVAEKVAQALGFLREIAAEHQPAVFASSLGAEDMVLTDLILKNNIGIEIFSLDTGRLPPETYDLLAATEKHYNTKLTVFYPNTQLAESFVRQNGINAFYDSVEQRKGCCYVRKVEPLTRALAGKSAWVTGMRAAQAATRGDLPEKQFDEGNGLWKYNPLSSWSEKEVWAYIKLNEVPYNALHEKFYPSIGCAPCTRAVTPGEDVRAGRWWWENPETKECGLHVKR